MDYKLGHIKEDSYIKICFVSSQLYFKYMLVALYSFAKNKYPNTFADVYVILDNVPKEVSNVLDKFQSSSLRIHKVDIDSNRAPQKYWVPSHSASASYVSPTTYVRLSLTDLLPDVSKILYLDSDVLIDDDISELYDMHLNGNAIAAVKDFGLIAFKGYQNPSWKYLVDEFPLLEKKYFNAGVMLIDLDQLRLDNYSQKCFEIFSQHPEFAFTDQDVLNYLYDDRTLVVHPKWNNCLLCNETYLPDMTWNNKYIDMFNACFGTSYKNFLHFSATTKIYHFWGDKDKFVMANPIMKSLVEKYKNGCDDFLKNG